MGGYVFFKKWAFVLTHFWPFWANFRIFFGHFGQNCWKTYLTWLFHCKKVERNWRNWAETKNDKFEIWPPKCPKTYPEPKMAPKMGKGQEKSCRFDMELPCRVMITLYRDQKRRQCRRQKYLLSKRRIETKKLHPWSADAFKHLIQCAIIFSVRTYICSTLHIFHNYSRSKKSAPWSAHKLKHLSADLNITHSGPSFLLCHA